MKMTKAEWLSALEECGGDMSQDDIINLVFKDGPSALWTNTVNQMHVIQNGLYSYLTGLFPTREWKDWSGVTEMGRTYHAAYIPFDLSIFQRSMQICNPGDANECHTDYCEIPQGGITNMPELEMYKAGFKTRPMCIANIRTSDQARQIAEAIIRERFSVDEQVMNMFYTMALIRMLGHKYVLEYEQSGTDVIPVTSTNPYNMVGGFRYSYMQPLFPAASNLNNIMPLDFNVLDLFGRSMASSRNQNFIATGPRGEPIYELWHPEDWYRQEIIDNPEYVERNKYRMSIDLLPGYRMSGTPDKQKEIVGNFSLRSVDALPRLAESTEGGLTIIQTHTNVAVDSGYRAIHNRVIDNAPFSMGIMIGRDVGNILSRPTISTGIEGRPIQPINGNGDWIYRNDYDKECNEDLNMPHFRKRFEMGFKMNNPDAGTGFIYRNKKFRLRPVSTCDLRPLIKVAPERLSCDILTIGCNPLNERMSNNIMDDSGGQRKVKCSAKACGSETIYRVEVRREDIDAISPDQNPLQGCACGDDIKVFIGDADGDTAKIRVATIIDYFRPNMVNPNPMFILELASALSEGECIQYIGCNDATPTSGRVVSCVDSTDSDSGVDEGQVKVVLDSPIPCDVGATVTLSYRDDEDAEIDTVSGTIVSINPDTMVYVISSVEEDFQCDMFEGQSYIVITCA